MQLKSRRFACVREILDHPCNRGRKLTALLRYVKWNLGRRLLAEADYAIELTDDRYVILSNHENYATMAYTCRLYDFEDMLFLLHFLRVGDAFGDFGANVGVYSVLAAVRDVRVLSIEPVPATYLRLRRNLQLNNVQGAAVNCGLAASRSKLLFTSDRGGMNRVAQAGDLHTVEVEVVTVDEVVASTRIAPALLKIDVEGYEYPLLLGAGGLLDGAVSALIVELNGSGRRYGYSDDTVHQFLGARGFAPYRYDPFRRALAARDEGINRRGFNTLYVRQSIVSEVRDRLTAAAPISLPFGDV